MSDDDRLDPIESIFTDIQKHNTSNNDQKEENYFIERQNFLRYQPNIRTFV